MTASIELYSPEFFADPFAYYGALREASPVYWHAGQEMWIVTNYAEVSAIIRKPRTFSAQLSRDTRPPSPPIRDADVPLHEYAGTFRSAEFIQMDPPEHTAKRAAVSPRFAPKQLESVRPMIREVIDELLDAVAPDRGMDVLDAVARPLPMIVISRLLGIDASDVSLIANQARKRMASVLTLDVDRMTTAVEGFAETAEYLGCPIDRRRDVPADDILGDVAQAECSGLYSRQESLANTMMIIDAGHETTVQLVLNATLLLMRNRTEWEALVADPSGLKESATEEALRYDPPLHGFRRVVAEDVELGDQQLKAGDRVLGVIASANRDPKRFADPERFDVRRSPNSHLAFGAGAHYCLGQYLARVEGQEYLAAVAERFPSLRLDGEGGVNYFSTPRVRSMTGLPVRWV